MAESFSELIAGIEQQPQRHDGSEAQLRDLQAVANKLGLYDAANVLKTALNGMESRRNISVQSNEFAMDALVLKEFEYIVALHRAHGAPSPVESVQELVDLVFTTVADGSRRPGAWERGFLYSMGVIAETAEHEVYRPKYGAPEG